MRFEATDPSVSVAGWRRGGQGRSGALAVDVAVIIICVVLVAAWLGRPSVRLTGDSDEPY